MVQDFESPRFGNLTTIIIDDEVWFIGKEVAEKLEYAYPKNAIRDNCVHQKLIKSSLF